MCHVSECLLHCSTSVLLLLCFTVQHMPSAANAS